MNRNIKINDLSLYLKKEKILVISDIHLGFEQALSVQGVLVPKFQLKETINKLKSVSLRNELGKNGKRAYKEKYNWNIMERKILEGYDSLK